MKIRLLIQVFIVIAFGGAAIADGFTSASNNSAKVWNKYPNSKRSIEWRGAVDSEGFASGRGVALFKNRGDVAGAYFGTMHEGRMEGHVVAIYPLTGLCYVGQISDWSESGYGSMRFPDGSRYEGQWREGNREGNGTQWHPGGDVAFQGKFTDDQPASGEKLFSRPDFAISNGGLVQRKFQSVKIRWYGAKDADGMASGFGVAVSSGENGISGIYHGLATAGRLDTNVVAIYANYNARMAFVGEIADWNENGFGQMFYPNGTTYIGRWKDEKRHGEGLMLSSRGDEYQRGLFEFDRFIAPTERAQIPATKLGRLAEAERGTHRFDEVPTNRSRASRSQQQAFENIIVMIIAQWGLDAMVDADKTEGGAFVSLMSRYFVRAPVIDNNLRVLLPDAPDVVIRLSRNIICSICDGDPSGEDLLRRTMRTESTALARQIGTTEGQTVQLLLFLNDFSNRVDKISKDRRR
jgi:hypothetical protein